MPPNKPNTASESPATANAISVLRAFIFSAILAIPHFGCNRDAVTTPQPALTLPQTPLIPIKAEEQPKPYIQKEEKERVVCPQGSLGLRKKYGDSACFIGDSYMGGIGDRKTERVWSFVGKSFATRIADEAKAILEEENCKLLVLNGGLNDMYGLKLEEFQGRVARVKADYAEVISLARKKGVETIAIYNVPLIPKPICKNGDCEEKKRAIRESTNEINTFLDNTNADYVIHTDRFIAGDDDTKWTKDKIHPKDYSCLSNAL